jgi:hypothetical protein
MIEFSLNEAEALAAKVARGAGFPWGLADDIGRAARALALRGAPWAAALLDLARHADGFAAPTPDRVARWRRSEDDLAAAAPLCPIRTAALLLDAGEDFGTAPLRLAGIGLPIWFEAMLAGAGVTARRVANSAAGEPLASAGDVTISAGPSPAPPPAARRAPIAPGVLAELLAIAGRVYVPESEGSRRRGAGGGSVDAD